MVKISSLEFGKNSFRKLCNLKFEFADRLTLIAGHNGIGKSTILGLIAAASGITGPKNTRYKSYFSKFYYVDINDIIHLDPSELENNTITPPWPRLVYSYLQNKEKKEHWKNIRITRRSGTERLRSVATTDSKSPDGGNLSAGKDKKVQLPTIYLGMIRMLPIGETSADDVDTIVDNTIDPEDAIYLRDFVASVIPQCSKEKTTEITTQTIKNTQKNSKHPAYLECTSKSVSLGQDSLSSIATAVASFHRLQRELGKNYQGGVLIIDEIDSGFHPHAQQKLIDALKNAARKLSLQIIATTHSPFLIEYVHPESPIQDNSRRVMDKVIYLAGDPPSIPDS